ncbi:dihydrofolate reductase family protein [Nocardioides nanhaiensis]|uniref:Dihydrofolate reductase family protein n=1 Tax=Nocardioides nanhaiensis TaxID=1476871 RepID=A0ABP8W6V5_9ACTN
MTAVVYYTASTLDGFLADEHDSLDWLLGQDMDHEGPMGYGEFIAGVGALVMGATTYRWVLEHGRRTGEPWGYTQPCFVFTHRDLPAPEGVRLVSGSVAEHWPAIAEAAGEGDVWVVGGGELAGAFWDTGHLDRLMVSTAPVTVGAGRPLLPRRLQLTLTRLERNRAFACAWYDVAGPGDRETWPPAGPRDLDEEHDAVR